MKKLLLLLMFVNFISCESKKSTTPTIIYVWQDNGWDWKTNAGNALYKEIYTTQQLNLNGYQFAINKKTIDDYGNTKSTTIPQAGIVKVDVEFFHELKKFKYMSNFSPKGQKVNGKEWRTKAEFPKPKAKMLYNVFLNLCTKKWGVSKKYEIKDGFSGYDCTLTIPNNY